MTEHTYLECDACGMSDPFTENHRGKFVTIMPLVPREADPTNTEYKTLHFCVRCFGPFAREMNRIARCFEKYKDERLQGKAESDDEV